MTVKPIFSSFEVTDFFIPTKIVLGYELSRAETQVATYSRSNAQMELFGEMLDLNYI